jgi:solute carrier family 39 (zinc transporter), member 1/2/3
MPLLMLKYTACLALLLLVLLPILYAQKYLKTTTFLNQAEALTAGLFLGAGLLHLLPSSLPQHAEAYPWSFLIIGITLLGFLLMEHILAEKNSLHQQDTPNICAIIMLCCHAFTAGLAVGISTQLNDASTLLLAIFAHKWIESVAFYTMLAQCTWFKTARGIFIVLFFALMTPLGILFGTQIHQLNDHTFINAVATGTFLYIGTLHGLKKSILIERCCHLKDFFLVILGYSIMAILAIWV